MFEVQSWGTTIQWTNYYREAEDAYKASRGEAVLFKIQGAEKKAIKQKHAQGFKLKDIARF
jgi:hypothetical protein